MLDIARGRRDIFVGVARPPGTKRKRKRKKENSVARHAVRRFISRRGTHFFPAAEIDVVRFQLPAGRIARADVTISHDDGNA